MGDNNKSMTESYLHGNHSEIMGNRMVSVSKMADLINHTFHGHVKFRPECPGKFVFPGQEEITCGICTALKLKCEICDYTSSSVKLYEEIPSNRPGRNAAKPNVQLTHFLSKSAISQSDVQLLFASVEGTCLSSNALQKNINKYSDTWQTVNIGKQSTS